MKSRVTNTMFGSLLTVGALCAMALGAERPEPQPISGKIRWVFDYEEGKQLSRASGMPMFVVFRCER